MFINHLSMIPLKKIKHKIIKKTDAGEENATGQHREKIIKIEN